MPARTSVDMLRFVAEFVDAMTRVECPLTRATTYYFSTSGDDTTGTGTQAAPWQTISKINTTIAAFDGNAGGLAILLKAGDTWDTTVGINVGKSHVTVGRYGTGADPYLNFYTTKFAASGWSQAGATNRYTRTASAPGDFREQLKPNKAFRKATSTAEVESTQNSYYHDGTTLHVHVANDAGTSISPNTVATECTLASTTDDSGVDVTAGTGIRVDSIHSEGSGIDGGSTNQEYSFKSQLTGTDICCFSNCTGRRQARHTHGHNGGSGGASGGCTLFLECVGGYATEANAAPFVSYCGDGAQEDWFVSCVTDYGALPNASRTYADGMAVIAHTDGVEEPGFIGVFNHRIPAPANGFGCHQGVQVSNFDHVLDPDEANCVIYGTRMERAVGTGSNGTSGHAFAIQGTVEINGQYNLLPLNSPVDAMGSYNPRGYVYNTLIRVDLTNAGMTEGWFAFWNASSTHDPKFRHCHIQIVSNGSTDFAFDYDNNFSGALEATVATSDGSELSNSIFDVVRINPADTAAVVRPALRNAGTYQHHDAFHGVSADGSIVGISNASNSVTLGVPPQWGGIPTASSPLVGMGEPSISYDFFGQPRSAVAPTIGPIEFVPATSIATTQAEANAALLEAIQAYVSPDNRDLAPVDHLWQLKRSGDGTLRSTNPLYVHAGDVRRVGFNCDITSLLPSGATLHSTGTPTTANTDLTLDATGIDPKIAKLTIEVADDATVSEEADDGSVTGSWVKMTITNSNGTGPIAVYGEVIIQEEP